MLSVLNGGVDYTVDFEGFITDGDITLGGASAGLGDFLIAYDNGSTSIQLSSVPEASAFLAWGIGTCLMCSMRRRV